MIVKRRSSDLNRFAERVGVAEIEARHSLVDDDGRLRTGAVAFVEFAPGQYGHAHYLKVVRAHSVELAGSILVANRREALDS